MKMMKLFATAIILLLVCAPANAQFKKLFNKAKDKAKEIVTQETPSDDRLSKDKEAKSEEFETTDTPDFRKKYQASDAAKTADPQASNTTVEKGFTKSVGELHAFYEHVDKELTCFLPYYKYPNFYRMDTPENSSYLMKRAEHMNINLLKTPVGQQYNVPYEKVTMADGSICHVPLDESFRHAWSNLFIADPTSISAFKSYAWVVLYQNPLNNVRLHYFMEDKGKGIIEAKSGSMLPDVKFYDKRWAREQTALDLARTVTDFDAIAQYTYSWFNAIAGCNEPFYKYFYYMMGVSLNDMVLEKHDKYDPNNTFIRKINMEMAKLKNEANAMEAAVIAKYTEAIPMPESKNVSQDIRNHAESAAKDYVGDKLYKVIFITDHWETFKEMKYPYRITGYRMKVAIITKEGNGYLMQQCDFQKSPEGTRYYMSAGMNSAKVPVKIK